MRTPAEYGALCEQFPDGTLLNVITEDGRTFRARSSGNGVAWVEGHAWVHPLGDEEYAQQNSRSWGRAKGFSL